MPSDLHDAATEAAKLAVKIGSTASDVASFVADVGEDFPLIHVVLKTLNNIRGTVDTLKQNREALQALHERCACIIACVVVKCRRSPRSEIDVTPLVERIKEVERMVQRHSRRNWLSRFMKASGDKEDIAHLHDCIGELTDDMGLAGTIAVERKVDDMKGLLVSFFFAGGCVSFISPQYKGSQSSIPRLFRTLVCAMSHFRPRGINVSIHQAPVIPKVS